MKPGNVDYRFKDNNDQYEDSFGEFTLNDPPSGEELYRTITCYLYGLATGYFRVLKEFKSSSLIIMILAIPDETSLRLESADKGHAHDRR